MPKDHQQFMRILLFFDLPVKTKHDRRHYSELRRFLLQDGYDMLQFSVYCRLCNGIENVKRHLHLLGAHVPPRGSLRTICVTEKQYYRMRHWIGVPTTHEKRVHATQLVLL